MGEVEVVEEYKCVSVHLDNRLDLETQQYSRLQEGTEYFVPSWGQSAEELLRSFKMHQILYKTAVESNLSSVGVTAFDLKNLNGLMEKAGSVLMTTVEPPEGCHQRLWCMDNM